MFGECHAHIAMDGVDYAAAMARHRDGVDESAIRGHFEEYRKRGISFVRDGGDAFGVSRRAKDIAPAYGIDYRTPIFAIHKRGHYGSIVGRAFDTMKEYARLVDEAAALGADFVKIMTTGIMDFDRYGAISGSALEAAEVAEMVHIAHEQGFAVMSHTNGAGPIMDALEAGVDSIEHGNFMDQVCIELLAKAQTAFVPTSVVAWNLIGTDRYENKVVCRVFEAERLAIASAFEKGAILAVGSDAGAVGVLHGEGLVEEYHCFMLAVPDRAALDLRLKAGEEFIKDRFRRQ